jgi:hypothetical protein
MCFRGKSEALTRLCGRQVSGGCFLLIGVSVLRKKCGLNGNSAPFYGLWSSGKVWLELVDRKCSFIVFYHTPPDMFLWMHAVHTL